MLGYLRTIHCSRIVSAHMPTHKTNHLMVVENDNDVRMSYMIYALFSCDTYVFVEWTSTGSLTIHFITIL